MFEIKCAHTPDEADGLLAQGIAQALARDCSTPPREEERLLAVLVFNGAARVFARWALVDQPEAAPASRS